MKRFVKFLLLIFPILVLAQQKDCNCCSKEQMAFDFWVGKWEVTDSNGKLAGHNTIVKEESGCVLKEKWVSARQGYTGTSINFYNTKTKQWEQLWVDNSGSVLKLKGNFFDNQMIMESEKTEDANGNLIINRITWTSNEDGTVRQLWEVLDENEKATIAFDGLYKRQKM